MRKKKRMEKWWLILKKICVYFLLMLDRMCKKLNVKKKAIFIRIKKKKSG